MQLMAYQRLLSDDEINALANIPTVTFFIKGGVDQGLDTKVGLNNQLADENGEKQGNCDTPILYTHNKETGKLTLITLERDWLMVNGSPINTYANNVAIL